jgi:prepilin-type processing-associated H-X9-DG protein
MRKIGRSGYTLFQLLVLLAFLALLIAMLLPAVQRMRAFAARNDSMNKLRQIGLALHHHHDAYNRLPSARDAKGFSPHTSLLPVIEESDLYKAVDFSKSPTDKANARVRATRLKVFISPLDLVPSCDPNSAPTNYLFVAGTNAPLKGNDGIFRLELTRMADVRDGLSNTLMVIETLKGDGQKSAVNVARQHVRLNKEALKGLNKEAGVKEFKANTNIIGERGGSWLDGRFLQTTININRAINDSKPDVDCGGDGGFSGPRTHVGGTNALFGDGHVRFIRDRADLLVLKQVTTRDGAEIVNFDDL